MGRGADRDDVLRGSRFALSEVSTRREPAMPAAQDDPVAEPSGTELSVTSRGDSAHDSVITDTSAVKIIRHTEGQPLAKAVHEAFQYPEPRRRFFAWFRALGADGEQRLLASVRKLNAMYVAADVIDKGLGPLLENGAARAEHVITVEYGPKLSRGAAQALCVTHAASKRASCHSRLHAPAADVLLLTHAHRRCPLPHPCAPPRPTGSPSARVSCVLRLVSTERRGRRTTWVARSGASSRRATALWRWRASHPGTHALPQRWSLMTRCRWRRTSTRHS
jgi:hypothetical protein